MQQVYLVNLGQMPVMQNLAYQQQQPMMLQNLNGQYMNSGLNLQYLAQNFKQNNDFQSSGTNFNDSQTSSETTTTPNPAGMVPKMLCDKMPSLCKEYQKKTGQLMEDGSIRDMSKNYHTETTTNTQQHNTQNTSVDRSRTLDTSGGNTQMGATGDNAVIWLI